MAVRCERFLGLRTGPNPTDRAKPGSKRHLICDGCGVPLAIQLTGANRNDSRQALALIDAIPLLQGGRGRPRHRPYCVLGDRGYDAEAIRRGLSARHIMPLLPKRNTEHGSGRGRARSTLESERRIFAGLTSKQRGELAKMMFMVKAAQKGFAAAKPFGDSRPYDFVVDVGRRLWCR